MGKVRTVKFGVCETGNRALEWCWNDSDNKWLGKLVIRFLKPSKFFSFYFTTSLAEKRSLTAVVAVTIATELCNSNCGKNFFWKTINHCLCNWWMDIWYAVGDTFYSVLLKKLCCCLYIPLFLHNNPSKQFIELNLLFGCYLAVYSLFLLHICCSNDINYHRLYDSIIAIILSKKKI